LPRFAEASRRDFGRREVASRQESRQDLPYDPGEILAAGIFVSWRDSQQDLGKILAAEIFASRRESPRDSLQDPRKILATGNFAYWRESCRDSFEIFAERKNRGGQNLAGMPAGFP